MKRLRPKRPDERVGSVIRTIVTDHPSNPDGG